MRVAFYTPLVKMKEDAASGDHVQARAIAEALELRGHRVRVVAKFRSKLFWRKPRRLARLPAAFSKADETVRRFRPDVWLTFASDRQVPDVLGPFLTSRYRIPYVIYKSPFRGHYRTLVAKEGRLAHLWSGLPGQLLNSLALARADQVVVNKAGDYHGLAADPRIAPKLSLLWPAVKTDAFAPNAAARARTREALGLDDDTKVVLSVCRLSDKTGRKAASVGFLIDCVADLLRGGANVHLLVLGDGDSRPALEARASRLGRHVTFAGGIAHEDLPRFYSAADVFAFPGLREIIGIVYLEAQAAALPVVAFDNGGIPSVVRDGETGFLVRPLDRSEFARRLAALVEDDEVRLRMGQAARDHVCESHDFGSWAARLSDALDAAVAARGASVGGR